MKILKKLSLLFGDPKSKKKPLTHEETKRLNVIHRPNNKNNMPKHSDNQATVIDLNKISKLVVYYSDGRQTTILLSAKI